MNNERLSHYIAGSWSTPPESAWAADINPSDATQTLAQVPQADGAVVKQAVEAAQQASRSWRATAGPLRAEILHRVANTLAGVRDYLGRVIACEVGKPVTEAVQE